MSLASLNYDAPTRLRGSSITLLPGKWIAFPGGYEVGRNRKYISITNEDTNTRLYIVAGPDQNANPDTDSIKFRMIGVDETLELWTNATIILKNTNAVETVSPIHVLELFYDGRPSQF